MLVLAHPAKRLPQVLGGVLLALVVWQAALLLTALPRSWGAGSYWLEVGVNLPLLLLCGVAGLALLRVRPSGFLPLYFAVVLLLLSSVVGFVPTLQRVLGPPRQGWAGR